MECGDDIHTVGSTIPTNEPDPHATKPLPAEEQYSCFPRLQVAQFAMRLQLAERNSEHITGFDSIGTPGSHNTAAERLLREPSVLAERNSSGTAFYRGMHASGTAE